ncbi:protein of unknown function [Azospirillum baldaniorum]|uniref:Uncharacterized protein n=1 Tax=Azospirillum baldaniorum TaxID=1064539 RepID=A0A9P1JS59_9PROT|nr:protein of unknown function [Azospirillum baldaniorum]
MFMNAIVCIQGRMIRNIRLLLNVAGKPQK